MGVEVIVVPMSGLSIEMIRQKLDNHLEDTPWKYRYWKKDRLIELRNISSNLPVEEIDKRIEEVMRELEDEGAFVHVLEGKMGLLREDGKLWKDGIDSEGEPLGKSVEIDEDEAEKFLRDGLDRVDNKIYPANLVEISPENVLDIYGEDVGSEFFVHINLQGDESITLRDDGGLQLRASK